MLLLVADLFTFLALPHASTTSVSAGYYMDL
jgi:hypothetical protein